MTAPTNKPSSAELREIAAQLSVGRHGDTTGVARMLLAGADAMDSLAAMRAQRDRLAAFVRRWDEIIVGGDKPSALEGWAREFTEEASAALAELEGGAS